MTPASPYTPLDRLTIAHGAEDDRAYVRRAVLAYPLVGELVQTLEMFHHYDKHKDCDVCDLFTRAQETLKGEAK